MNSGKKERRKKKNSENESDTSSSPDVSNYHVSSHGSDVFTQEVYNSTDLPVYESTQVAYDDNLLERSRTQWQFGDWTSLTNISVESIQHHPDRAKLALLAAAGYLQNNDNKKARQLLKLAKGWGCDKYSIYQILIAGVYNSLGRASAASGQLVRAHKHFENAIIVGMPRGDVRLLAHARSQEQLGQLGITADTSRYSLVNQSYTGIIAGGKSAKSSQIENSIKHSNNFNYSLLSGSFLNGISYRLGLDEDGINQSSALRDIESCMQSILNNNEAPDLDITTLSSEGHKFKFVHAKNDYIPKKIAEGKDFYESDFLSQLHQFHDPSGVIIDVGANIGNHTVFFAKIMGANVLAIEPEPHNAICLSVNCYINNIQDRVSIIHSAIGANQGTVELSMAIGSNYGSFTADISLNPNSDPHKQFNKGVTVPLTTLDNLECDKPVSIIKIDVEGMEMDVVRGGKQLIGKYLPVVAVECFNSELFEEIKAELLPMDYFPVALVNATPTFIFINRKNSFHIRSLSLVLAEKLDANATRRFSSK